MAMLHFLVSEGYSCEVAHVNFQLRGESSMKDAALVREISEGYGLEFHKLSVDTRKYAQDHKQSIEMAAREIRYDFFERIMEERHLHYVAVAHHRNDIVETFFINLMRGTGLKGLGGISPKNGRVVRPFLQSSHNELLAYLDDNDFAYCTDETNFDETILRNNFRHNIIPQLEELKPSFTEIMQSTVARLRESEAVVGAYAEDWKAKHVRVEDGVAYIDKAALYASVSPSEILFQILRSYGFAPSIINEISSDEKHRVGAHFYSKSHRLVVDREAFIIDSPEEDEAVFFIEKKDALITSPLKMEVSLFDREDSFRLVRDSALAFLDADKLTFPLCLRKWQEGDIFCPIGMGGKQKKVSDFFIDNKFSVPQKEKTWLLCSGKDIVWIVGHRMDERYKLTDDTSSICKITL